MTPLLIVIGPSGAGKSTIVRQLAGQGIITILPTWTTRPRRATERGWCPEHRFVTDAAFASLDAVGFFRLTGHQDGLTHRYGLPAVERFGMGIPAVIARAKYVPILARDRSVLVYQVVAPPAVLAARLACREAPEEVTARLAAMNAEIASGDAVSHRSFSNDGSLENVVAQMSTALSTDMRGAAA